MDKKDYLNLQSKYTRLQNLMELYRKDLLAYIHEAFDKHGDEFEYKCDTHATWQEKNQDDDADFDVMNDLPTCLTIWVEDDGGHEVYPTAIRQYVDGIGCKHLEADVWDLNDCCWVTYQQLHSSIEDLQSVAEFISAVLEQEMCNE